MKYMTFNSSCSFAGVANMLLQLGIDVEDRQIALGMHLPYLFDHKDGHYAAGPMLQTSDWFNLYLHPLGYAMTETAVSRADVPDYLSRCGTAMLGLRIAPTGKHAVVFQRMEAGSFHFINNKHQHSDAPETICLSKSELMERLDDTVMVAALEKIPVASPAFSDLLQRSCQVLEQYKLDIQTFCGVEQTKETLASAMNTLFRATLLDGITMLELIAQDALADQFRLIQRPFLQALREGRPVMLRERLNMPAWLAAIDQYIALIRHQARHLSDQSTRIQ